MTLDKADETFSQADVQLDPRRVRSFLGLVLGRLGPRAHGAVAGVFLALLVGEHTSSLFWITFALTAHRLITWIANPLAGRLSDRTDSGLGRRVPFMAGGLLVAGACTAAYTSVDSFWPLVGLIVLARLALTAYIVPASAVTPETFGNTRWLRAGAAVSVGGLIVGLSIRGTVIATWDQNDPSTWSTSYFLAAGYVVFAGLVIALLVREAPSTRKLVKKDRQSSFRQTIRALLAKPNAKVLLAGLLLAVSAGSAFQRVYPIYARDMLGSGGDSLAIAGMAEAALGIAFFPLAWVLAGRVKRRQLAVLAGLTGCAGALLHFWVSSLWQSVLILAISGMFLGAVGIALAPMYLQILPRGGGLGERIGLVGAPFLVAGMLSSFASALAFDLWKSDYRVIWGITAVLGLCGGLVMLRLRIPPGAERAEPIALWRALRDILWGRRRGGGRQLFRGEIEAHEADGTQLLELVADELNPYTQRS